MENLHMGKTVLISFLLFFLCSESFSVQVPSYGDLFITQKQCSLKNFIKYPWLKGKLISNLNTNAIAVISNPIISEIPKLFS